MSAPAGYVELARLAVGEEPAIAAPAGRLVTGGSFVFDAPAEIPTVWGRGEDVAWAAGEPCEFVGPSGIGKTTLAQRVVLGRIGLASDVLGLPVTPDSRKVLYVAADRPRQAQRSFRRMVREEDRARLDEMVTVHKGPLHFDIAADPPRLARWARELEAGTVVLDSLKDVAADLIKDEVGCRVNAAFQHLVADNIEVLALHHQRKATGENRKPRTLADVYGSTWLTAGAGSVILLWGDPGDPILELSHLKQPALEVGPLRVLVDHLAGSVTVQEDTDPLVILRSAPKGLTPADAARLFYGSSSPADRDVERARRKLESFRARGLAYRKDAEPVRGAVKLSATYFAVAMAGQEELL